MVKAKPLIPQNRFFHSTHKGCQVKAPVALHPFTIKTIHAHSTARLSRSPSSITADDSGVHTQISRVINELSYLPHQPLFSLSIAVKPPNSPTPIPSPAGAASAARPGQTCSGSVPIISLSPSATSREPREFPRSLWIPVCPGKASTKPFRVSGAPTSIPSSRS